MTTCTNLIPSKGTKISIGSALVAPTYTEIGMVESFGELGPESNIGTFTPVGTGLACKFMGTTDNGELTLTIAKTTSDAGLNALLAAQQLDGALPFKLELSDGTTFTFDGITRSAKVAIGTGDDVVKINAAIAISGAIVES